MEEREARYKMKNSGASKFITSFIYILFGLALMVWPQRVESVICTILAVCVIILGAFLFHVFYRIGNFQFQNHRSSPEL